jgi:hypothetical protein
VSDFFVIFWDQKSDFDICKGFIWNECQIFMEVRLELGTVLKLESAPEPEPAPKPILCKFSALQFFKKIFQNIYGLYSIPK